MTHSKYSPSSSSKWLYCTASILEESKYPKKQNLEANKGTIYHKLCHNALEKYKLDNNFNYFDYISKELQEDEEDVKLSLIYYIEHIIKYINDTAYDVYLEELLYYNKKYNAYGTADAIAYNNNDKTLNIIDLKTGRTKINVFNNEQLMLYALGFINSYKKKTDTIYLTIVQGDNINSSKVNLNKFKLFVSKVNNTIQDIEKGKLRYLPSEEVCKFCKHNNNCIELKKKIDNNKIVSNTKNNQLSLTTDADKKEFMKLFPLLTKINEKITTEFLERIEKGEEIKGVTLEAGRSLRKLDDEKIEELEKILGDNIYQKKIKSIKNLEILCKVNGIENPSAYVNKFTKKIKTKTKLKIN